MVLPSSGSRVFYEIMGQYIEKFMCNIAVGSEYFLILKDQCISKVHIKVADTVDEHHATGIIYGCSVAC